MAQTFSQAAQLDSSPSLTKWAKEPTVLDLKADLQLAQPSHDTQVTKIKNWLELRDAEGASKPKKVANRSSVQPKLVRKQAEWRYSALTEPFLSTDTLFKVSPVTWEDEDGAVQNGQVLNHQFRTKIPRVKFIDEFVRTTTDEGTCYLKPGWCRYTKMEKVEVPVWSYSEDQSPEVIEMLNKAIEIQDTNPQGFQDLPEDLKAAVDYTRETGIPVVAQQVGTEVVDEEKIIENHPTIEILHFENVYIDPSCGGDLDKANFVVISFETSKAKLKKDGRYKNLDKVNWSSNSPLHEPNHATAANNWGQFKDELRRPVVAYEYWGFYDIHGNDTLVPIVATWIGSTMIRMELNPYPDQKLPLVLVPYMPVKHSLTGEPDAELLGDNQAILGAITRGMIDLLGRSANGQRGTAKGMLDAVNQRRFDRGENYLFNPQTTPAAGFYEHTYPEIPQSALVMLNLQHQEAESLSGVKAFSGGLSGQAFGEVAAGIRGVLDAASKREMSILRRMAEGMEQVGRKFISMNQVFLSEEEVVEITNGKFVKVNRNDIQGEYNTKVDIVTAEIEEAQAQDLGFMLQTMGNTLPFEITKDILVEIATLKRMPRLAHQLKNYVPQPNPLQQKREELEIAKLNAEIAELNAKAVLAQAKAREVASSADLKDLDFLEQETGTKQARDLQKQQAQAEANQGLEITKAVLAPKDKKPSEKDLFRAVDLQNVAASRI